MKMKYKKRMPGKIMKLHLLIQHMNQVLKDPIEYKEPTSNPRTFSMNRNIMENIYSSSPIIISSVLAKPLWWSSSSLYKIFLQPLLLCRWKVPSFHSYMNWIKEKVLSTRYGDDEYIRLLSARNCVCLLYTSDAADE